MSYAFSTGGTPLPDGALERIREEYLQAKKERPSPIWKDILALNGNFYEMLAAGKDVLPLLDNPGYTNLFYGMDNFHQQTTVDLKASKKNREGLHAQHINTLFKLAEAVGAKRLPHPEVPPPPEPLLLEELLDKISEKVGYEIDFPNPFPDEFGIATPRGIAAHRSMYAIYQAWRVKQLAKGPVVEIGAGLGRTAYYAMRMGVTNYTIVDLPESNVLQRNFLLRVGSPAKILSVEGYRENGEAPFDLLLNADGLTEMTEEMAEYYVKRFLRSGRIFLSINHEGNPFTVAGLVPLEGHCLWRYPYALRAGYVEEVFVA